MWLRQANRTLREQSFPCTTSFLTINPERYTPWQVIVSTLTALYAIRNLDKIFGLGCKSNTTSCILYHLKPHSARTPCPPGELNKVTPTYEIIYPSPSTLHPTIEPLG